MVSTLEEGNAHHASHVAEAAETTIETSSVEAPTEQDGASSLTYTEEFAEGIVLPSSSDQEKETGEDHDHDNKDHGHDDDDVGDNNDRDNTTLTNSSQLDLTQIPDEDAFELDQTQERDLTFTLTEALHLRKNLGQTFEQQAHASYTTMAIRDLNQGRRLAGGSINKKGSEANLPRNVVFQGEIKRRQLGADGIHPLENGVRKRNESFRVFLRIRPCAEGTDCSTVKVIPPPTVEEVERSPIHAPERTLPTTVQTIPPIDSNAYKCLRGASTAAATTTEGLAVIPVKEFAFTGVLDADVSQTQVYQVTVQPLLSGLLTRAESALVFCYGITNAGKTYTVLGPEDPSTSLKGWVHGASLVPPAPWGLLPRVLFDLVQSCCGCGGLGSTTQHLSLCFFEIYQERVYDLLPAISDTNTCSLTGPPPYRFHQGPIIKDTSAASTSTDQHPLLRGVTFHPVNTLEQGLAYLERAQRARKSSSNGINRDSSRSHAICQLRVTTSYAVPSNPTEEVAAGNATTTVAASPQHADLWIVDLAGNERPKKTEGSAVLVQEASIINKSLVTLNRCLSMLREKQERLESNISHNVLPVRIPYRDSKLTSIFAHHWMGPCAGRTTMIVNIHPSPVDYDETQHVLAYATAVKTVQLPLANSMTEESSATAVEYDYDGRRKKPVNVANGNLLQKVVAKVIQKLSPKRLAADGNHLRRQLGKRKTLVSAKTEGVATDAQAACTAGPLAPGKVQGDGHPPEAKKSRSLVEGGPMSKSAGGINSQGNDGADANRAVKNLNMELSVAKAELSMLRIQNQELVAQLESIETNVRNEVAEEMEAQMQAICEQYQRILEDLKCSQAIIAPDHPRESCLSDKVATRNDVADEKIQELHDKVEDCEEEMNRMRQEADEAMAAAREELRAQISLKDEEISQLRALLAEAQESQQRGHSQQSSQEPVTRRNPLESLSQNTTRSEGTDEICSSSDETTFGPDQWLFPKKIAKKDPATGTFQRPRGRAPTGTEGWDENKGAWRLSVAPSQQRQESDARSKKIDLTYYFNKKAVDENRYSNIREC